MMDAGHRDMKKYQQAFESAWNHSQESHLWGWRSHSVSTSNGVSSGQKHQAPSLDAEQTRIPTEALHPLLVALRRPGAFECEPYRTLSQLLEQRAQTDETCRMVAISSPSVNDGKTVVTLNLAGVLAQNPQMRVLVVDADLRRPSLATYLGLERAHQPGLVEAIHDPSLSLDQVVLYHPSLNLSVLLSGYPTNSPFEVLGTPRLGTLLSEARQQYDYVLVDTCPLIPFTDCRFLAPCIDGFLVIATAHKTPRKLIDEALATLPGKLIGLVFNQDTRSLSSAYQYYRYPSIRRKTR